jgi:hypothetical protein
LFNRKNDADCVIFPSLVERLILLGLLWLGALKTLRGDVAN